MNLRLWLTLLTAFSSLTAFAGPTELQRFLLVDRFQYYLGELAQTVKKRGHPDIADALGKITPVVIESEVPSDQLSDPKDYDELAAKLIHEHSPGLQFAESDLQWNYNFFKNKLTEGFRYVPNPKLDQIPQGPIKPGTVPLHFTYPVVTVNPADLTLDAGHYIANRTTRAVFWDASQDGEQIEFHMGGPREFQAALAERKGVILGEVKPLARNYNKIYLVQYPDSLKPVYAFTNLGGYDRIEHLTRQISISAWPGASASESHTPSTVTVFGSASPAKLEQDALTLTQQMKTLPNPDVVVIGQKGALESSFRAASNADAVLRLYESHPDEVTAALDAASIKKISKLKAAGVFSALKDGATWATLYEKLQPVFTATHTDPKVNPQAFRLENFTHDISDFLFQDASGNTKRMRVISNMWGDEIIPVASALKASGSKKIFYIGTAGSLPGSDLKVGDAFIPNSVTDPSGKTMPIPNHLLSVPGAKMGGSVVTVKTPFEETKDWLANAGQTHQAVEIETGPLAQALGDQTSGLQIVLLISDIVDSDDDTLEHAQSSDRKSALNSVLSAIFSEEQAVRPLDAGAVGASFSKVSLPANLEESLRSQTKGRDPISIFQIRQAALRTNVQNEAELEKLISESPKFTATDVEKTLLATESALSELAKALSKSPLSANILLPDSLLRGDWNPKSGPLLIYLTVDRATDLISVRSRVDDFLSKRPEMKSLLRVGLVRGPPAEGTSKLSTFEKNSSASEQSILLDIYNHAALQNGGLAATQVSTHGALKYTQIPVGDSTSLEDHPHQVLFSFYDSANPPDLRPSLPAIQDGLAYLTKEVTPKASYNLSYDVIVTEESELPGGKQSDLVPEIEPNGRIAFHLKITNEGAHNPGVIASLIVELDGAKDNPAAWIEDYLNAKAGSLPAQLALVQMRIGARFVESVQLEKLLKTRGVFSDKDAQALAQEYSLGQSFAAQSEYEKLAKEVKVYFARRMKEYQTGEPLRREIEKEPKKLDQLIKENDRKGVARILKAFLPWALMEPVERESWTSWVDAIENPHPENRILLFRGLDQQNDLLEKGSKTKDFFAATLLSRNQGNYTHRLRSLLRNRSGDPKENFNLGKKFADHAVNPKGSPFLSTSDFNVADRFLYENRGFSAIYIDPRRVVPSPFSVETEYEQLIPLFVFPDEIVVKWAKEKAATIKTPAGKAEFLKEVESVIGRPITPEEMDQDSTGYRKFKNRAILEFTAPLSGITRIQKPEHSVESAAVKSEFVMPQPTLNSSKAENVSNPKKPNPIKKWFMSCFLSKIKN